MEKTVTLEEALKRIEELEKENAELREELEYYSCLLYTSHASMPHATEHISSA